jgi:hypothetical protein
MSDSLDKHIGKQDSDSVSVLLVGGPQDGAGLVKSLHWPIFRVQWRYEGEESRTYYQIMQFRGQIGERKFLVFAAAPTEWGEQQLDLVSDVLATSIIKTITEDEAFTDEDEAILELQYEANPWNTF